jgi:hypothetical protein
MARELRSIQQALARASREQTSAPSRVRSSPNLVRSSPNLVRSSHRQAIAPANPDTSTAIGEWVAAKLSDLQSIEQAAERALTEGRVQRPVDPTDDPALWDADRVAKWLGETANVSTEIVLAIWEQGVSGLELLTLDDADLSALRMPLSERKRTLDLIRTLREQAAAAAGLLAPRASCDIGLQTHLNARRKRLAVLYECFSRMLIHIAPTVPLKTRRLLHALWQQAEAVSLEALARVERDALTLSRRDEGVADRCRRKARFAVEAQLKARAECEDRIEQLDTALR